MLSLFKRRKSLYTDGQIELLLTQAGMRDASSGIRDGYTFDICLCGQRQPIGYISLRLGESPALYYLGHIGYRIHASHRGHGYAGRALRLLIPLMRREGLLHPVITTNPDNLPSRYTCLHAGCVLERIAPVPAEHREVCAGAAFKCRYILAIPPEEDLGL
ncbi:MAG: GNAT family N-acetyltransferase [Christensenellales bacterium]